MSLQPALIERVEAWIEADPNRMDRDELRTMLASEEEIPGSFAEELADRFDGRLAFGTAGLRAAIGAGPNRMNDAVVMQTTAGLADVLEAQVAGARERGVVVGHDARIRSPQFAAAVTAVLTARGFTVYAWDRATPTPITPFLITRLGAAAGVQVTASHNPPQDNGYKAYWEHAAQIIPPVDAEIAAAIQVVAAAGPARYIPTFDADDPAAEKMTRRLGASELDEYRQAVIAANPAPPPAPQAAALRVVYTAMHGVGQAVLLDVLNAAGFTQVTPVAEQGEPDGAFPTVAFPNPEEPGALDLAMANAAEVDADLIIANDPDADRLAVALPPTEPGGAWQTLTGNDVGALLGDFVLAHTDEPHPLVVASVVSSELLGRIAQHRGARFAQCLTGFKWVMAEARRIEAEGPERFVFGFEEALGYCVGRQVADKDGISAALALLSLAAGLKAQGRSLADALATLDERHGAWVTAQTVRRFSGGDAAERMAAVMDRVRAATPPEVGGLPLTGAVDFLERSPASNLLDLRYGDSLRVLVRPSGTEPKVKIYFEWRDPAGRQAGRRRLAELQQAWDRVDPASGG